LRGLFVAVIGEMQSKAETESEDRLSFMSDKVLEINLLKSDNSKFIKGLIPPLLKKN
jgi:hypothetical protein